MLAPYTCGLASAQAPFSLRPPWEAAFVVPFFPHAADVPAVQPYCLPVHQHPHAAHAMADTDTNPNLDEDELLSSGNSDIDETTEEGSARLDRRQAIHMRAIGRQ